MKKHRDRQRGKSPPSNWGIYYLALIAFGAAVFLIWSSLFPNNCKALGFVLFAALLNELSPRELFARCAALPADEAAWHEFFRRYHKDICMGICRVIGFPPHGSHSHLFEDAMQGFNLRLLENNRRALLSFRGQADFQARAFLRKVAASVAANVLRSQPPASGSLEDRIFFKNEERFTRSETIADQSSAYEDFILLRGAIEYCLDKILHGQHKFRNILIFKLAVYDGFSAEELAAMPGLNMRSTHAVEQLLSRIRKKLLAYLESQ